MAQKVSAREIKANQANAIGAKPAGWVQCPGCPAGHYVDPKLYDGHCYMHSGYGLYPSAWLDDEDY